MERYESYKDSGVAWIGKVPSHWIHFRIKFCLSRSVAGIWGDDEKGNKDDIVCFRVADFDYSKGCLTFDKLTIRNVSAAQLLNRLLHDGDLLIEKSGGGDVTPVGRVVRFNYNDKAICSNFIHSISVKEGYSSNYLYYYFYGMYANKVNLLYFNQTTGIQNLKVGEYLSQKIYLPTLVEQQAIAAYLDKRCSEIDKAIATQQKRIALLQELKQSIITRAVTQGIHPDVPLKESGVEWIGKVPKHWEVRRMKFLTREYKAGPFGSALITSKLSDNGSVLVYTPEHIANQSTQLVNNLYLPETRAKEMSKFFVKVNDAIFSIVGTLGRAMLITEDMPKGIINQRLAKFSVNEKDILIEYLLWLFAHSIFYEHYMQLYQRGSVIVNLTKEIIGNMPVPLPPINEQYQIVAYLKECTIKLDTYIAHAEQRIALLQELKQSIITEAITGKIKVC